jgi:hypothetical protein
MSNKRNRLSIRIRWMVEPQAEGPLAIIVLFALVAAILLAKGLGWW